MAPDGALLMEAIAAFVRERDPCLFISCCLLKLSVYGSLGRLGSLKDRQFIYKLLVPTFMDSSLGHLEQFVNQLETL